MHHDDTQLDRSATALPVTLSFESVSEDRPGDKWRRIFRHGWPGWLDWSDSHAPKLDSAERALRRHMPEFAPIWEQLIEIADGDERAARFLTFWSPPRYLANCSQAMLIDQNGPVLIRNYDLEPALNEARLLKSAWLGRNVMGMVEGMAGLSDGMNAAGLAASLTFGGRTATGRGFGIPLILRYVLEVCSDVAEATDALRALPCHMSYNVTLLDRHGHHATVMLAPDRPAIVTDARFTTNHQLGVEWPRHARLSQTLERETFLKATLADPGLDRSGLHDLFLAPPLHSRRYGQGFGTVYTAMYCPAEGAMQISWPGHAPWRQKFAAFAEEQRNVIYHDGLAPSAGPIVFSTPPKHHQVTTETPPAHHRKSRGRDGLNLPGSANLAQCKEPTL
jgi:predicted choloylglycine hydrolase